MKSFEYLHCSKNINISRLYPHILIWVLTILEVLIAYFLITVISKKFLAEPPIFIHFLGFFLSFCYITSMLFFYRIPKGSSSGCLWDCILIWIIALFGVPLIFLAWFLSPLKGLILGLYFIALIMFTRWSFKHYNSKLSSLYHRIKFFEFIKRKIYFLKEGKIENDLIRKKFIMSLKLSLFYSTLVILIVALMVNLSFVTDFHLYDSLPINKMIYNVIAVQKFAFTMSLAGFLLSFYITSCISLTSHFVLKKLNIFSGDNCKLRY